MKKRAAAAVVVAALAGVAVSLAGRPALDPARCYVRKPATPGTCECQGNELLKNRSPRNTKNYPEWGDCGGIPRPGNLMRGDICVPAPCPGVHTVTQSAERVLLDLKP